MFHSLLPPGFRRIILIVFVWCLSLSSVRLSAQSPPSPTPPQDAPAKTDSTAKLPPAPAAAQGEEVSSHETPTTFKVRVNLVLVRVVVRDAHGKIVPNLKKEDFQLYDNRKVQTISKRKTFSYTITARCKQSLPLAWRRPRLARLQRWHPLLQSHPARMSPAAKPLFCRSDLSPWSSTTCTSPWRTPCSSAIRRPDSLKDLQPAIVFRSLPPPVS